MSLWEARANSEIHHAYSVSSLVLRNQLPEVIAELAGTVDKQKNGTPFTIAQELTRRETAEEHGKQRARTEVYRLPEVIKEFHILRQVIFEVLEETAPLSKLDRDIIVNSFEQTVNDSACMFAELQIKTHERFTITLVHDLRSPLSAIKMAAQVARVQAANVPTIHFALDKIAKNATRMSSMIGEMLDVSLIRAGKGFVVHAKEMRLDELVNEMVKYLTESYGFRFEARANEPITGCWDNEGLRRIIENLAINALKYGNGTSPVVIYAEQGDEHVTLKVHNDGNPIPPDAQAKLFENFNGGANTKSATGWGLGLALVKGMAEAHRGTVRVESSLDRGTDFIVELPKVCSAAPLQAAS